MSEELVIDVIEAQEAHHRGTGVTPAQEYKAEIVQRKIAKGLVNVNDIDFYQDMTKDPGVHSAKIFSLLDDIEKDPQLNDDIRNKMMLVKLHNELHRNNSNIKKNEKTIQSMDIKDINKMLKEARLKQMADKIPPVKVIK